MFYVDALGTEKTSEFPTLAQAEYDIEKESWAAPTKTFGLRVGDIRCWKELWLRGKMLSSVEVV